MAKLELAMIELAYVAVELTKFDLANGHVPIHRSIARHFFNHLHDLIAEYEERIAQEARRRSGRAIWSEIKDVAEALPTGVYNMLEMYYVGGEHSKYPWDLSDASLLAMRNIGTKALGSIRRVLPDSGVLQA